MPSRPICQIQLPAQLIVDEMFGYRVVGPNEDLERDYRDNAFGMPKSVVIDPTFDQKRKLQANAN